MQTILVKCLENIMFPLQLQILHKRSAAQLPKILLRNLNNRRWQLPTKPKTIVHCSN